MTNKRKINETVVDELESEIKKLNREVNSIHQDNLALRSRNTMLLDLLGDVAANEDYWSSDAVKSGILFRFKNILNQLRSESE